MAEVEMPGIDYGAVINAVFFALLGVTALLWALSVEHTFDLVHFAHERERP